MILVFPRRPKPWTALVDPVASRDTCVAASSARPRGDVLPVFFFSYFLWEFNGVGVSFPGVVFYPRSTLDPLLSPTLLPPPLARPTLLVFRRF